VCVYIYIIVTYVVMSKKGFKHLTETCIEFDKRLYLLRCCKLGIDVQLRGLMSLQMFGQASIN